MSEKIIPYTTRAQLNRCRRLRQLRRNIFIFILSTIFIIVISVLLLSFSTEANEGEQKPSCKYFKSVKLSEGDTLWSVASKYMDYEHYKDINVYIKEIMEMNSLTSDKIFAGRHIIVPYYSTEFTSTEAVP